MIIEIKVGANSRIIDCLVAKPIRYFGISGLVKFNAVLREAVKFYERNSISIL